MVQNILSESMDQLGYVASNSFVKVRLGEAEEKIIPITEVKVGDHVLSYDTERDVAEYVKVTEISEISVEAKDQIKITTEDGTHIITSVWNLFPIFDASKGIIRFIRSDRVKIGNTTLGDNELFKKVVKIERGEEISCDKKFIGLSVKGNGNYFCSTDNSDQNVCFDLICDVKS